MVNLANLSESAVGELLQDGRQQRSKLFIRKRVCMPELFPVRAAVLNKILATKYRRFHEGGIYNAAFEEDSPEVLSRNRVVQLVVTVFLKDLLLTLNTAYAKELKKGMWHRGNGEFPEVAGSDAWANQDPIFNKAMGLPYATTLCVMPSPDGVALSLHIGTNRSWIIKCASLEGISVEKLNELSEGRVFVCSKHITQPIEMSLLEYIAHKTQGGFHPDLTRIDEQMALNAEYLAGLGLGNTHRTLE